MIRIGTRISADWLDRPEDLKFIKQIGVDYVDIVLDMVPGYDEAPVARHMKGQEIEISVDVGVGRGRATIWTCDLTHGYISINADYRS